MTQITVNTYAELRQYTGSKPSVEVEIATGTKIRHVLDQLGIPVDQARILFVNSRAAAVDDVLQGGDKLDLFSAIGGG